MSFPAYDQGVTAEALSVSPESEGYRNAGVGLLSALAFAQGQWRKADRQLSRLAVGEKEWSLEMRTLFSVFLSGFSPSPIPEIDLTRLRDSIADWLPGEGVEIPSYVNLFGPHAQHHPEFRLYLLGLLNACLGEVEGAREHSLELRAYGTSEETRDLAQALSLSVDAHAADVRGEKETALRAFESIDYFPRFEFISASPFFSRALDRWLRGELLVELDRPGEALAWYNTLSDGWGEFLFAGPAHLRQAQIYEELADTASAIHHYQEFVRLWSEADPVFGGLLAEAGEALDALGAGSSPSQDPPR